MKRTVLFFVVAFLTGIADEFMDLMRSIDLEALATSPENVSEFTEFVAKRVAPLSIAISFIY